MAKLGSSWLRRKPTRTVIPGPMADPLLTDPATSAWNAATDRLSGRSGRGSGALRMEKPVAPTQLNRPGLAEKGLVEKEFVTMKEPTLRKWHRYAGGVLAPLVLLQAVSGLFLSFEWLYGLHTAAGKLMPEASPLVQFWDWVAIGVHYGGGPLGALYHGLLGVGMVWFAVSGIWIFLKIRARMKKR